MTYTEWRDELKNNLLCVSESERRRVLDYYAEAYADRREAGFSEREIIEDFGAPYDAAQRILCDRQDYSDDDIYPERDERDGRRSRDENRRRRDEERDKERERDRDDRGERDGERDRERDGKRRDDDDDGDKRDKKDDTKGEHRVLYALLCVIFCVPLFGLLMGMVGITIGFCVAPFAVLISGVAVAGGGIGTIVSGEVYSGLCALGGGIIVFGVGVILISLFTKLVKLLWKLWDSFFKWVKSLFGIKEKEKVK